MEWKATKVPAGSKLFKVHNFNFLHNGINYILEIDEFSNSTFTGHGEHSTDKNFVIESVSGSSLQECLEALISRVETRAP